MSEFTDEMDRRASCKRDPMPFALQMALEETRHCTCNYEPGPCGDCRKLFAQAAQYRYRGDGLD
jgi:hypothetical protein